jgi:hypothetical protein
VFEEIGGGLLVVFRWEIAEEIAAVVAQQFAEFGDAWQECPVHH